MTEVSFATTSRPDGLVTLTKTPVPLPVAGVTAPVTSTVWPVSYDDALVCTLIE